MRLIVEMKFDYDGLDEDFPEEMRAQLLAALESGAESTCSDIRVDGVYLEKTTAIIPKDHLEELLNDQNKLNCLQAAGVDNWIGYGEAMQMMEEDEGDC